MRRVILFLLFFLWIGTTYNGSIGQSGDSLTRKPPKLMLALSVVHVGFHAIKLEAIIPINKNLYLNVSPEFYSGKLSYEDEGQLSGLGLHSGLRYNYWQYERKGSGVMAFAEAGLEYNYFNINTRDKYWVERVQNGQSVMVLEEGDVYKRYNRFGTNYRMGGLWYYPSGFYFEWSFGVAMRRTEATFSDNYFPTYKNDKYPWSYAYTGVSPLFGLRFGFLIR